MNEKLKRKREYWSQAFPDFKYLILIKVVPEQVGRFELRARRKNEPMTWRVPTMRFESK